jgi:hypothetical protein
MRLTLYPDREGPVAAARRCRQAVETGDYVVVEAGEVPSGAWITIFARLCGPRVDRCLAGRLAFYIRAARVWEQ